MDFDCIEIERRLAIGLNDYLSIAPRHRLVRSGMPSTGGPEAGITRSSGTERRTSLSSDLSRPIFRT